MEQIPMWKNDRILHLECAKFDFEWHVHAWTFFRPRPWTTIINILCAWWFWSMELIIWICLKYFVQNKHQNENFNKFVHRWLRQQRRWREPEQQPSRQAEHFPKWPNKIRLRFIFSCDLKSSKIYEIIWKNMK